MKHIVHYNASGRIESLIIVNGPHGMNAGVAPRPGQLAAEVEGLNIGYGVPDVEAFRRLVKDQKFPAGPRAALQKK